MIRSLTDVDADSVALVGGKGANLGELVAAGVPVPSAFCVTTSAYRAVPRRDNGLLARIDAVLDARRLLVPGGRRGNRRPIRALIVEAPMPPEIVQEITRGLRPHAYRRRRYQCGRPPRPRTCRARRSPVSRTPTSTSRERRASSTPCGAAGHRSGPTARWPTATPGVRPRGGVHWPSWCRRCSRPRSPACCSPPTR